MNNHIAYDRKDIVSYQDLRTGEQVPLPANSPCEIELADVDLEAIYGGGADIHTGGDAGKEKDPLEDLTKFLRPTLQGLPVRSSLLED